MKKYKIYNNGQKKNVLTNNEKVMGSSFGAGVAFLGASNALNIYNNGSFNTYHNPSTLISSSCYKAIKPFINK